MAIKTFKIGLDTNDRANMQNTIQTNTINALVDAYSSSSTYEVGDYVNYQGVIYKCTTAIVSGETWTPAHWEQASLNDLIDDVNDAVASVNNKANVSDLENGTLVVNKAVTAEQIENVSDETGSYQTAPFLFQASGTANNTTETPVAPVAKQLELRGHTIAWNQLIKNGNFADTSNWSTTGGTISASNNILTFEINSTPTSVASQRINQLVNLITGHKYLVSVSVKTPYATDIMTFMKNNFDIIGRTNANSWTRLSKIYTAIYSTSSGNLYFDCFNQSSYQIGDTIQVKDYVIIDLTLMFNGKTDGAYKQYFDGTSYEYGSGAGTTVTLTGPECFSRDFPKPYYPYNAGTLMSCNSSKLINIEENAFDGVLELGRFDTLTGREVENNNQLRTKNNIKVIAGQTYTMEYTGNVTGVSVWGILLDGNENVINGSDWTGPDSTSINAKRLCGYNLKKGTFTLPSNACYLRFYLTTDYGTTYNNDICFHLTWDESFTGYKPYVKHEYNLPTGELRSAGTVYDEKQPNGHKIIRLSKNSSSLKTWGWTANSSYSNVYQKDLGGLIKNASGWGAKANIICSKYITVTANEIANATVDKAIAVTPAGVIWVRDTSCADLTAFTNALTDNDAIVYEKDTYEETDTTDTFAENVNDNDFGTMEFVPTDDTVEVIVPQGNRFFYLADYVLLLDDLYNYVKDDDGSSDINSLVLKGDLSNTDPQNLKGVVDLYAIMQENIGGVLRQCLCVKESLNFENTLIIDLGSFDWQYANGVFNGTVQLNTPYISGTTIPKIISTKYATDTYNNVSGKVSDKRITVRGGDKLVYVYDTSYTDATAFKNAMKGILLAYEKA